MDVASGHIARVGTSSIVSYTPMNELDYGTLLCWASNQIGHQQVPCVYHIIPAGKSFKEFFREKKLPSNPKKYEL